MPELDHVTGLATRGELHRFLESRPLAVVVVIADVDLHHLKDLHDKGSVRNLRQRRTDLYEVTSK